VTPLTDAQLQLESDGYLLVESLCDPEFVAHLLEGFTEPERSGDVSAGNAAHRHW
jgi:hypothetical protein